MRGALIGTRGPSAASSVSRTGSVTGVGHGSRSTAGFRGRAAFGAGAGAGTTRIS